MLSRAPYLFLFLLLTGCNKISSTDITVIEGVKLGTTIEELHNQFDSLKILQHNFYTKLMFTNKDESNHSAIRVYATDLFNTAEYRSEITQHYGVYHPTSLMGTRNVVSLNVILVHTGNALLISNNGISNITKQENMSGISQNISYNQVNDIANLISKKYGTPADTLKFETTKFYVIQGNQILNSVTDSLNRGELIIWKTKYLDIKFFKGVPSRNSVFDSKEHSYLTYFDDNPFRDINYDKGERSCRSFCYISYELNSDAIKKLGLDKVKL